MEQIELQRAIEAILFASGERLELSRLAMALQTDEQVAVYSTDARAVIFSTAQLLPKTTRNTQGVSVMSLKKKAAVSYAVKAADSGITNQSRYRTRTLPSAGAILKQEDTPEKQISFEL
jgi:DNA gyrase subunit A